jgi:hypothetical protein
MKIISCPKGVRIPEGYCKKTCLNYPHVSQGKNETNFKNNGKTVLIKILSVR